MVMAPAPPAAAQVSPEEELFEDEWEDENYEEFGDGTTAEDFESLPGELNDNPLNALGNDLEQLLQSQINDDLWEAMLGDLPCLDTSIECVAQLQNLAVSNHRSLMAIDQRIELVEDRIAEARADNRRSVTLGSFTPYLESLFQLETETQQVLEPNLLTGQLQIVTEREEVGFFQKLARAIANPLQGINQMLSFIGIPLFNGTFRIGADQQQRNIAIGDLQARVAQIGAERQKIADTIAEQVVVQVLDFDVSRREFQIAQEVARRQVIQHQLFAIDYRFGNYDTNQYLQGLSRIDQEKAKTFRAWARMRSQLIRIKLLVLGTEGI